MKSNLPVLLLKSFVLLPLEDSRIELNNEISKEIITLAEKEDGYLLVVTPLNNLEESPDTTDIPNVGVVAKIKSKIELPNKNYRIVLTGIKRAKVLSYENIGGKDILSSTIVTYKEPNYDEVVLTALYRTLMGELEKYISANPFITNSIINKIKDINDLEILTDRIASFIPLTYEKKLGLMLDLSKTSRAKKLITELNVELAVLELENKIDNTLKKNLDNMQKEMILKEKIKIINEELGIKDNKNSFVEKINEMIENNDYPVNIKNRIQRELSKCVTMSEMSPELSVTYNYLDYITSIPFNKFTKEETDLKKIKESLDNSHYALDEVKTRIIEYIAVKDKTNKSKSPIICLVGPPGVGKTTLGESIAKSLNINYVKISLGGLNDPAELVGHRKTYIGSEPGKIITSLIKAKSMNPLILLDEVDKISKDYKGDPASCLLDLLDITQNKRFVDNYIEEEVDLSNVTWILTANDLSNIPYVLLDRLEIIELSSYLDYEKLNISKNYLIPLAKEENNIENINVEFTDSCIYKIILSYTKESGVRNLYRLISKILRKVVTESKLNDKELTQIKITKEDIVKYLGSEVFDKRIALSEVGLTTALAYTPYGGEILNIEVTSYDGESEFITSGSLGDVLKESINVAISYIKSNLDKFNISREALKKTIHINFREGAIPKDGPSAGISLTSAIISYLKNIKVPSNVSFTGEITLLGDVLKVGGLKEKLASITKYGIDTVYLSIDNMKDVEKLSKEITNKLKIKYVSNYSEIYEDLFKGGTNEKKRISKKTVSR